MNSGFPDTNRCVSLSDLVARVPDGASLGIGGSFLHRGPFAFVRELIRQQKRGIEVVKQSPGYDIDILCRAGVATRARCGIVAMEGNFGLAPHYRKAVESGALKLEEHACASLTAGLRAAAFGVPFQPCAGLHGSDLTRINNWACIEDPYGSGVSTWVIPAIAPDFAVIHANCVDRQGNVRIAGTYHWDRIISRAARNVLVVAEEISDDDFSVQPELTVIPYFMVEAYAIVPNSAWPGSCWPRYAVDYAAVEAYLAPGEGVLGAHLADAPEERSLHHA